MFGVFFCMFGVLRCPPLYERRLHIHRNCVYFSLDLTIISIYRLSELIFHIIPLPIYHISILECLLESGNKLGLYHFFLFLTIIITFFPITVKICEMGGIKCRFLANMGSFYAFIG